MNTKQKKALIEHVTRSNPYVQRMDIRIEEDGEINIKYLLDEECTSVSPDIETLCKEEIEKLQKEIEFYSNLRNL